MYFSKKGEQVASLRNPLAENSSAPSSSLTSEIKMATVKDAEMGDIVRLDYSYQAVMGENDQDRKNYPAISETQRHFYDIIREGISIFLKVVLGYFLVFFWACIMALADFFSLYIIHPFLGTARWMVDVAFVPAIQIASKPFIIVLELVWGSMGMCFSRINVTRNEVKMPQKV